ncbi:hypothetical protein [Calderihabitans maritimus]|uniref:Uncharacterized protein n=1 Tax=Calderihabitans maritimus TaxID=1246530 RepID=A0A1Z5HVI4_9FIRM|nr:hypothetical protein [Calderihabitans maritimus]GAW93341.1 hypothetical protein CHY_0720 [Calderihabitans maritimus]
MKCIRCEFCGAELAQQVCTLVLAEEPDPQEFCWCVCDTCREDFQKRTMRVLLDKGS